MNKKIFRKNLRALMLEATYHKKTYVGLVALILLSATVASLVSTLTNNASAITCPSGNCDASFQVQVQDTLSVAVTAPISGASGNVNEFLRNQVDLSINSNVANGFTASMYSLSTTDLVHEILGSSTYIPTMSSSATRGSFPVNKWGYSLKSASLDNKTYGETDAGNNSSTYHPLIASTSSPIKVLEAGSGTKSGTQSIYFGAKADTEKPSGTYSNTVIISVVTGTVAPEDPNNPITPTNPATPGTDPIPSDSAGEYTGANTTTGTGISGSNGTTVRTSVSSTSTTTTTTTEVSAGDNTSSYTTPQGVNISTQSNIVDGSATLPIGIAVTAATTATTGIIFFIIAKRDDDDDDEEEDI